MCIHAIVCLDKNSRDRTVVHVGKTCGPTACFGLAINIGVAPITQLRMCVRKIVKFKGGHPMW